MELELESILLPGIEDKRPMVIAGPCSAETEEQVMCTAKQLAEKGMKIFRAGIWKPRTKPGGFEGVGVDGLAWLKEVEVERLADWLCEEYEVDRETARKDVEKDHEGRGRDWQ